MSCDKHGTKGIFPSRLFPKPVGFFSWLYWSFTMHRRNIFFFLFFLIFKVRVKPKSRWVFYLCCLKVAVFCKQYGLAHIRDIVTISQLGYRFCMKFNFCSSEARQAVYVRKCALLKCSSFIGNSRIKLPKLHITGAVHLLKVLGWISIKS